MAGTTRAIRRKNGTSYDGTTARNNKPAADYQLFPAWLQLSRSPHAKIQATVARLDIAAGRNSALREHVSARRKRAFDTLRVLFILGV